MQRGLFVMRPADRSGLARRPDDDQTQTNQYGNAYRSQDDAGNDQTHAHDASPWIVDVRGEYAGLNVNKDLHGGSRM